MKNFLLTVSLLSFFSIKPMDPPAISSNENQKIYIKTSDGKAEELELWKIDEMKELSTLLGAQGSNSLVNPLTISLTLQQLNLVSNALDALAQGNFDNFYASLVKKDAKLLKPGQTPLSIDGNLRRLINAADKVGAAAISALCLAQVIPSDIQKKGLIPLIISNIKTAPLQSLSNPTDIISIAFSPNGKQIVFGCRGPKNNLIIWNNETGQKLHLAGHDRDVLTVAFSPDGKKIVSGSADDENNLIIWDSQTGQQLHNLVGHSDYVLTVAFSPDGNQIVSGCDDNEDNLIIWDSQTGQQLHNLIGHPNDVTTAAFSPDGKKIVSGCDSHHDNLMIWDSQTGTQLHNLVSHLNNVITVAFSPDGKKIVSGADDDENNLIIWDSETGQQLHDLSQPNDVLTAALSPDGKKIVAGIRKSLIVWDCKTGQQLHKLVGHADDITGVAFSPDSSIIVSGCRGKKNNLIMWNSATGQPLHIFNNAPQEVKIITFSPDGRKFGCSTNNSILIFPLLSAEEEKALDNCTFEQAHLLYQVSLAAAAKANIRPLLLQRINALPSILQDIAKRFLTINHSRSLSN